jgi:hypothetical protein
MAALGSDDSKINLNLVDLRSGAIVGTLLVNGLLFLLFSIFSNNFQRDIQISFPACK